MDTVPAAPRFDLVAARAVDPTKNPAIVMLAAAKSPETERAYGNALAWLGRKLAPDAFTDTDGEPIRGVAAVEVAKALPWHGLSPEHFRAAAALVERDTTSGMRTRALRLNVLRNLARECWRLGHLDRDALERVLDGVRVTSSSSGEPPAGRMLETGDLLALFKSCAEDGTLSARLDAALLALLAGAALRRSEAAALDLEHVRDDGEGLTLRVLGKGKKVREVPIEDTGAVAALRGWLAARGEDNVALFPHVRKGDRLDTGTRLSDRAIADRLERRALRAGVPPFTPHDLRRTYASAALDAGADLAIVADLLGHANVATTRRYDRRPARARRRAAALVKLPFVNFGGPSTSHADLGTEIARQR
jgi:integrase/recombinase XerD